MSATRACGSGRSKGKRAPKYVYRFGGRRTEGNAAMKNLLGGKGANLAEMCHLGLPVPAGFTITTECCNEYFRRGQRFPPSLKAEVMDALAHVEEAMGAKFGDPQRPLLVSCRSGARRSMPGMMETVLNIGLCSRTLPGLIAWTGNERFAYDSYRRLIAMYADVVMEKAEGIEPPENQGIRKQLDDLLDAYKREKGYRSDTDLTAEDLKRLVEQYKERVQAVLGRPFPDDPWEQLWGGIAAVFKSWNGKRAVAYRRIEGIPDDWGTAVNVQAMVFGNMGEHSATGVAFTRNPATGENAFYGEWLVNAQGEDVVAGIRTPNPLNEATKNEQNAHLPSLEKAMPEVYAQLDAFRRKLERHYRDMQDIEFTIQEGKLYMLQCRVGKRNGIAAVRMAMEMLQEKLIDAPTALLRVAPSQLDEWLHPILDPKEEQQHTPIAKGLPAGPGGACGRIVFTAADAVRLSQQEEEVEGPNGTKIRRKIPVILLREETNPEDVEGMRAAVGILTARGGMTSHAALVARGWGKCCIVGAGDLHVDPVGKTVRIKDQTFREGDEFSLNGTTGLVYAGRIRMVEPSAGEAYRRYYLPFMRLADRYRTLGVRTNADTPADARRAREFGAEGIGLFRTEHMFYGEGSDQPLFLLRKMILSRTEAERRRALDELFPFVKASVKATLEAMEGLPVTIRLLDPPLHEFVPREPAKQQALAEALGIPVEDVRQRGEQLHEANPMMGHRGVRLGITYPEVTEMQVRAILEAAGEILKAGGRCRPEIMIPVTCDVRELRHQREICRKVHDELCSKMGLKKIPYAYGTMIEIPRAALLADEMAEEAEFFSFGTNDLTQMGFGFSRDDMGSFLPAYLEQKLIPADPFATIDQKGVGQLIRIAVERGRKTRPNLKIGICGEQGGDPDSVQFCHDVGLDYVSCSPYRVPIARLAAAQAAVRAQAQRRSKAKK